MDQAWIFVSIFAAFMQAIRTAGQKDLNRHLSTMAVTYVRALFGVIPLFVLLLVLFLYEGTAPPAVSWKIIGYCFITAIFQIWATALLVHLFTLKNFAVATMLPRCETIFVALLGVAFFSEVITATGWVAIVLSVAGVLAISVGRLQAGPGHMWLRPEAGWGEVLTGRAVQVGLLAGLLFALCSLALREAMLLFRGGTVVYQGVLAVVIVNTMQLGMQTLWFLWRDRQVWGKIAPHWRTCQFVGLTSALGSAGWFIAIGLQNASYVKAVGQVEAIFSLLIAWFYFRERIGRLELAGIALIVAGVITFRL